MEDAVITALHTAITHLNRGNIYVSSVLIQSSDIAKQSGLRHFTVHMDTGFLSNRPQKVRIGRSHISHTHPEHWHTTGVCSQPPPLLPFHQWLFPHSSYKYHGQVCCHQITTIVGLISDNSETAYIEEIKHFTEMLFFTEAFHFLRLFRFLCLWFWR